MDLECMRNALREPEVVGSIDGFWLAGAILLGMALVVGIARPFARPQVNALQTSCFACASAVRKLRSRSSGTFTVEVDDLSGLRTAHRVGQMFLAKSMLFVHMVPPPRPGLSSDRLPLAGAGLPHELAAAGVPGPGPASPAAAALPAAARLL